MMLTDTAKKLVLNLDPLPDSVWKAWTTYSLVQDIQPTELDLVRDLATADDTDLETILERHVEHRLRRTEQRNVKNEAETYLARLLIGAVADAGTELIRTCLQPAFTDAAATFTEAHAALPGNYTDAATLLQSDPSVVENFQKARAAADVLDATQLHRQRIANIVGELPPGDRQIAHGTTHADVTNYAAARRAAEAMTVNVRTNPLGCWGALLETKGVLGLHLFTAAEHAAYIATVDPAENHYERGAIGHHLVEV